MSYRAMNTRPREQSLTLIAIALTFGSGAADVASFTRLGNVFTSVMTGNIVLWGLAAASRSLTLFSHTAVAIAGYIVGVAGGTWVAHGAKEEASASQEGVLPGHVIWVLLAELTLLAGFTVGWEVTGGRPAGWAQFGLLATLAGAMGMQSSAVRDMGLTEVSTTYLTGTLTGLVSSLVSPGQDTPHGIRRFGGPDRAGGRREPLRPVRRDRGPRGAGAAAGCAAHHAGSGHHAGLAECTPQHRKRPSGLIGIAIFACLIAILVDAMGQQLPGLPGKDCSGPGILLIQDR